MRFKVLLLCSMFVPLLSLVSAVQAEQPRDWMVAAQPGGTHLNLDVVFPGVQAQIEHRIPIYGQVNELTLRANALPTLLFFESQADADLRFTVLALGGSFGVRETFHGLEFGRGENWDRGARRDREFAGDFIKTFAMYGEGRATLSLPFNDNVVFNSINALRYEGGRDRVFDWRLGIMRDHGVLFRSDTTLYLKHRSFGAIGPRIQVLNFLLDDNRNTQLNYGFTFTTRPGFRRRNDIFFLSLLFGFGGTTNGRPTSNIYGAHLFKAPVTFEIAYRSVIELWHPEEPGGDADED